MEDKLQALYDNLVKDNYDLPAYDVFKADMGDPVKSKKLHDTLLGDNYAVPDYDTFTNDLGLKKKIYSLESLAEGKNPLESLGVGQEKSITPPLQSKPNKPLTYEDTLPEDIHPTAVIKSSANRNEFTKQKHTDLTTTLKQELQDEAKQLQQEFKDKAKAENEAVKKLNEDYKAKTKTEGADTEKIQKEYDKKFKEHEARLEDLNKEQELKLANLEISKQKEAEKQINDLFKEQEYEVIEKGDVKNIQKKVQEILTGKGTFEEKRKAIESIRDVFSAQVEATIPEYASKVKKEINDVIAKSAIFDNEGQVTPFGWKKEAQRKLADIQASDTKIRTEFQQKYPDFQEYTTATFGGMPVTHGKSMKADQGTPEQRKQFSADYEQYKKDVSLMAIAQENLGKVLELPEDKANFLTAFKAGGKDLLYAYSSAGWSDVAKALETSAIAIKQQKGEKLSEGEKAAFEAKAIFDTAYGQLEGGKLGKVVAQGIPFIESMWTMGVAGLGQGLVKGTIKQILAREGAKLISKEGMKVVGKTLGKMAITSLEAAPMSPISYTRQQQGIQGQTKLTGEGEWTADKATVEGWVEATAKGMYTGATEYFSESLGELVGVAGKPFTKVAQRLGWKSFRVPKAFTEIAKTVKFNGIGGEIMEELINIPLQAPTGDQPLSEVTLQDIWDTIWTTAGFTAILGSAAMPGSILNSVQRSRNMNLINIFGKENVLAVRLAIEKGDMRAWNDAISVALGNKTEAELGMTKEEAINQLHNYSKSLATERVLRANPDVNQAEETTQVEKGEQQFYDKSQQEKLDQFDRLLKEEPNNPYWEQMKKALQEDPVGYWNYQVNLQQSYVQQNKDVGVGKNGLSPNPEAEMDLAHAEKMLAIAKKLQSATTTGTPIEEAEVAPHVVETKTPEDIAKETNTTYIGSMGEEGNMLDQYNVTTPDGQQATFSVKQGATAQEVATKRDVITKGFEIRAEREAYDAKIQEAQDRLGLSTTPDILISDSVEDTLDKIEKGEPVLNESLKEASDNLYAEYKRLNQMKSATKREYTTEQIDDMMEVLGEEITKLNNRINEQAATGEFQTKETQLTDEVKVSEITEIGKGTVIEPTKTRVTADEGKVISPESITSTKPSPTNTNVEKTQTRKEEIFGELEALTQAPQSQEQHHAELTQALNGLTEKAPSALPIRVVKTQDELPPEMREQLKRLSGARFLAINDPETGIVWFVSENISDIDKAISTWVHEQGVHTGLRLLFPSERYLNIFLHNLFDNLGLDKIAQTVDSSYIASYKKGTLSKAELAEEYLAAISEKIITKENLTQAEKGAWQKIVDLIKSAIFDLLGRQVVLTDEQIADIIRASVGSLYASNKNSIDVSEQGVRAKPSLRASMEAYEDWREDVTKKLTTLGRTKSYINKILANADLIYNIALAKPSLFPTGHSSKGTPIRDNVDPLYIKSIDMSADCPKRMAFAPTVKALKEQVRKEFGREITNKDIMHVLLDAKISGKTTPCIYCYVESPRINQEEMIGRWIDTMQGKDVPELFKDDKEGWKAKTAKFLRQYVKENGITREDIDIDAIASGQPPKVKFEFKKPYQYKQKLVPELHKLLFMLSTSQAKAVEPYEEYKGQIWNIPQNRIDFWNESAGLRWFSSSDFLPEHMLDLVQVLSDMTARNMAGHVYTKVEDLVKVFAKTGMKIQISLFMEGGTEANPKSDSSYSFDFKKAQEFRKDNPDVGTEIMIVNNKQLLWALATDWIDYIIPFHSSGSRIHKQAGFTDYQDEQKEHFTSAVNVGKGRQKIGASDNYLVDSELQAQGWKIWDKPPKLSDIPQEWIDKGWIAVDYKSDGKTVKNWSISVRSKHYGAVEGISDAKARENYLNICKTMGIIPVFANVRMEDGRSIIEHPNYIKVKKDYSRTDTPLRPVDVSKIDQDAASEVINKYMNSEEATLRNVPQTDVVDMAMEELRANKGKPFSDDQIANKMVEAGIRPKPSMQSFPPAPNTDTPAFKKWFGDSKVVDEKGNPKVLYHGTGRDFDTFEADARNPIFLTSDPTFASWFSSKGPAQSIMPLYARAENPFDYSNPKHIKQLITHLEKYFESMGRQAPYPLETLNTRLAHGNYVFIEPHRQEIKDAGFDGFYIEETGRKNLAVFDPNQVKSATGNIGTYSLTENNIRLSAEDTDPLREKKIDAIVRLMNVNKEEGKKTLSKEDIARLEGYGIDQSIIEEAHDRFRGVTSTEKQLGAQERVLNQAESDQQQILSDIIDENEEFYTVLSGEQVLRNANKFIEEKGIEGATRDLEGKTTDTSDYPTRQVARMILIDHYTRILGRSSSTKAEKDNAYLATEKLQSILSKEANKTGQGNAHLNLWKVMQPAGLLEFTKRKINEFNKRKLGKKIKDKTAGQLIDALYDTISETNKKIIDNILEGKEIEKKLPKEPDKPRPIPTKRTVVPKVVKEEREYRKNILDAFKAKRASAPKPSMKASATGTALTVDEIDLAVNLLGSYVREGSYRQDDVVKRLTSDLKTVGIDLTVDDVDVIMGQPYKGKATFRSWMQSQEAQVKLRSEMKSLKLRIQDVVKMHWSQRDALGRTLAQKLVDDAGLTEPEASELAKAIIEEYDKKIKERLDSMKELSDILGKEKIPTEKKGKKSMMDKMLETINLGALDEKLFKDLFAEKFGLAPEMSDEQSMKIIQLANTVQQMTGKGWFYRDAVIDMAKYMYEMMPQSMTDEFIETWVALAYANMLSGIPTSILNLWSSGSNMALKPLRDTVNFSRWAKMLRGRNTGGKADFYVPFGEMYYLPLLQGMVHGGREAAEIYKNGDVSSKFVEGITSADQFRVGQLDRNKHGKGKRFKPLRIFGIDINPGNLMKYVGRNLSAQDRLMWNTDFDMEVAQVLRENLVGKGLKGKALRDAVISYIQGGKIDMVAILQQIEDEATQYKSLSGKETSERQKKIRLRELIIKGLPITEEQKADAEELARQNVFTGERGGLIATTAYAIGKAVNSSPLAGLLGKGFFPFTKIVGNVTESMIDHTPFYGFLRANGWSPSVVIKRNLMGKHADPSSLTAQMGERGSVLYYEQMGRAWLGTVTFLALSAFLMWRDDDDDVQVSGGYNQEAFKKGAGKANVMPKYTLRIKIGDKNIDIPYLNIPGLAIPLGLIGNYNDALRTKMPEEEANLRLLASMLTAGPKENPIIQTMFMVKDMSFITGAQDLMEMLSNIFSTEEYKWKQAGLQMAKTYLGFALRPLPQNATIVQQTWKFFDPASYSSKDIKSVLAYSAGLQHIYGYPTIDQLGDQMKTYPGENLMPYTFWFNIKGQDARWRFLADNNAIPDKINNFKTHIEDDDPIMPVKFRSMEPQELYNYSKEVGNIFTKDLEAYMQDAKKVDKRANDRISEEKRGEMEVRSGIQVDVEKMWNDARNEARIKVFSWYDFKKDNEADWNLMIQQGALKPPATTSPEIEVNKKKIELTPRQLVEYNQYLMEDYHKHVMKYLKDSKKVEKDKAHPSKNESYDSHFEEEISGKWTEAKATAKKRMEDVLKEGLVK